MWVPLKNFQRTEFGTWADKMSPRLLVLLDVFRDFWGAPVRTVESLGVAGGLGRYLAPDADSQHNISRWREVRAVDVQPQGMTGAEDFRRAYRLAARVGFTGIGLYPDHTPTPGLHLDVREDRRVGDPATWSAFTVRDRDGMAQKYFGIDYALEGRRL